ncbi:MAG: MMPL family transporter [Frankiaceae bacterium]|nr:MMPL family transporter [Frankiaceae bacterium]
MRPPLTGRLARASARRPWLTIGLWAATLAVALPLAGQVDGAVTPHVRNLVTTESDAGRELDETHRSAGSQTYDETVILTSSAASFGEPSFDAAVATVVRTMDAVDGVERVTAPTAEAGVGESGRTALVQVQTEADTKVVKALVDAVSELDVDGFELLVSGTESGELAFTDLASEQLARGELIGVAAALVVLLLVLGALVAASIPLGVAFVSVLSAMAMVAVVGRALELTEGVLVLTTMLGLALSIDYSLVSLQRFREELGRGRSVLDAVTATGSTANRAILFSGVTVMLSLSGLLLIPTTEYVGIALSVIFVAVSSVVTTLTLLPAVLRLLGHRLNRGRVPGTDPTREPVGWQRTARAVISRPAVATIAGVLVLLVCAAPLASLRLAHPGPESLPEDFVTHRASALLVEEFGRGQSATTIAVDDAASAADEVVALAMAVDADPAFSDTTVDRRGDVAFIDTHDRYDSADPRAEEAIERLRTELVPAALAGTAATAYVTGDQAASIDGIDLLLSRAWMVVAFVLGTSFLLLLVMFRSIVIPLKAITLNLLGAAATFGAMVAAYQWGWGSTLLGFPEVEGISPYMPVITFALLFGLSMDYHVFLLSRIKEGYDATGSTASAVVHGLGRTGRLITGAAAIMVAVFSGFAASDIPVLSQWGFGLGFAVLIDATIIRTLLLPAAMVWIGDSNWYLPRWLEWLPHFGVTAQPTELPAAEPEPALV